MRKAILDIGEIVIDNKLFPRKKVNKRIVYIYRDNMERGDVFPDLFIGFFKGKNYLIDGRHRYEAYNLLGIKHIQCEIKTNFTSYKEMFLSAVRCNLKHGHQLMKEDKLKIAYTMKDMDYVADDISKLSGIEINTLDKMFVNKASKIIIENKIKEKEIPSMIREQSKKDDRSIGVVDSEGKIITKKELRDDEDTAQLNEIYKFLKYRNFNMKNKKISELLFKIDKLKLWGKK